jgi:hypothetical protein
LDSHDWAVGLQDRVQEVDEQVRLGGTAEERLEDHVHPRIDRVREHDVIGGGSGAHEHRVQ